MSAPEQVQQPHLSPEHLCQMLEAELKKNEDAIENCQKQIEALKASIAKLKA